MRGKAKLLIALALGLLLAAATAVSVAAQTTPPAQATPPAGTCPLGCPGGVGERGGHMYGPNVLDELLDMTVAEIAAERQKGRSLAEIAADKGVAKEQLVDALLAPHAARLDAMVAAGRLAAEQKQLMLDRMETQMAAAVESTNTGPLAGAGCGMMGGWNDGTATPGQGSAYRGGRMGAGMMGMMGGFGPAFSRN